MRDWIQNGELVSSLSFPLYFGVPVTNLNTYEIRVGVQMKERTEVEKVLVSRCEEFEGFFWLDGHQGRVSVP